MSKNAKRLGLDVAIVLVVFVAIQAYQTRSHRRGSAPRAVVSTLDGKTLTLGQTHDEAVLLHFWATWCGVCRLEESSVISIANHARVISISTSSGSDADVQRYVREAGITYPFINDPDGKLAKTYGVTAFPTTFFLTPDGTLTTSTTGYTTYLGLYLRAFWTNL